MLQTGNALPTKAHPGPYKLATIQADDHRTGAARGQQQVRPERPPSPPSPQGLALHSGARDKLARRGKHTLVLGAGESQPSLPAAAPAMQFDDYAFRRRVDRALGTARKFLETSRAPVLAEDVSHEYTDKFLLAEFVTGCGAAAAALPAASETQHPTASRAAVPACPPCSTVSSSSGWTNPS